MKALIVESPTKSKTLKKFLGKNYKVASTMGHIRDLPKTKLGVDVENNFKPKYITIPRVRKNIKKLKDAVKKADEIILATDEDREGEAIAWHLIRLLNLDKNNYKRIAFHEITKTAVKKALKNHRKIDQNLVNAQQARRILDRLVGYKLSPFLWKKVARGLSAGRVQSVALRLIVEREREIKSFKPKEYWKITADLKSEQEKDSQSFSARLIKRNNQKIKKFSIKTKQQAQKIVKELKEAEYKVEKVQKKERNKRPLPPFSTSTLQQTAWNRFRFPAKFTMSLAQNLYEKGYITYHRTDSLNLSQSSLNQAKNYINKNYGNKYWAGKFKKYKAKGKAQQAHEAIRPTRAPKNPSSLKSKFKDAQFKLYDLIWKRFIASQMAPAKLDQTKIDIKAQNSIFRASGQILKFDGFLKVYPVKTKQEELPPVEKGEILDLKKISPSQHFTQPPPRFTEASLIKALKKNGIGRPSTYAPILSNIQSKNYIRKNSDKRFFPTEIGITVNDVLVEHFPKVVDIKFTAKMEDELDEIAAGQKNYPEICQEFYTPFQRNLAQKYKQVSKKDIAEEETDKKCPKCKKPLIKKLGRYGKFFACSGFPDCKYTAPLPKKKIGINCPKCKKGEIVEKRTKRGKIFYGCNRYPKCDFALWNKPVSKEKDKTQIKKCPKCNSALIESNSGKIKCSNKKCSYEESKN